MRTGPQLARLGVVLAAVVTGPLGCLAAVPNGTLPAHLTGEQFWRLSEALSEPPGVFTHSDNLVSNEVFYVHSVRQLRARAGVYIGVGPEQNFSYIARLEPAMAFVIDIRKENRNLHLMYKALFALSADRATFVSRLFSREPPAGPGERMSVDALFEAYAAARPSAVLRDSTARLVRAYLLDDQKWPLTAGDLDSIELALNAFHEDGPDIHYGRGRADTEPRPSYRTLMTARDVGGLPRSYLSSEATFAVVKRLHERNLIVPVVGDFGGRGVIERVGEYVRQQGGRVAAFYGSNVEVYLTNQQTAAFCASLAGLPYESGAWFISSRGSVPMSSKLTTCR